MRSAYVDHSPHSDAKHAFSFGLRHGVIKTTQRFPWSDAAPRTVAMPDATRPVFAPAPASLIPSARPAPNPAVPSKKNCPDAPKCLTSFPKDWLWTAAPARGPGAEASWPGNAKRGRSIRRGDLFGA